MTSEQLAAIERLRELKNSDEHWDDDKVQAAFDEAMPLIEALQQSLSEAQADARVFSGSYNALAEDFGRLKEENERLRAGIKDVAAKFAEMTDLRDHFYYEMETAQTEEVFAKREVKRLRKGIGRALDELKYQTDARQLAAVIDAIKELEALHDA